MAPRSREPDHGQRPPAYRLVVEGELDAGRAAWFGAASLQAAHGRTTLWLPSLDQAALHGVLRRVRDVNLHIVELARLPEQDGDPDDASQEPSQTDN